MWEPPSATANGLVTPRDPRLLTIADVPPEEYDARYEAAKAVLLADGTPAACLIKPVVEGKMLELLATGRPEACSAPDAESAWMQDLGLPFREATGSRPVQALGRAPPANDAPAAAGGAP
jgi:hypothetical protein